MPHSSNLWPSDTDARRRSWKADVQVLAFSFSSDLSGLIYCILCNSIPCPVLCPWEGGESQLQGDSDFVVFDGQ